MSRFSRREFLLGGAAGAAGLALGRGPATADATLGAAGKYVTSYYQFTDESVRILAKEALPNGPQYLHVFVQSAPGTKPRPHPARLVQSYGESFKYGYAFDLNKYK